MKLSDKSKNVLTIVLSVLLIIITLPLIAFASMNYIASAETDHASSLVTTQMAYYDEYSNKLDENNKVKAEMAKASSKSEGDIENIADISGPVKTDTNGDKVYTIQWGDTLCKISRHFSASVDALADYNNIRNVNLIYANSDLRIPSYN